MDILKRPMAPITDEAWTEIDSTVTKTLRAQLSARKIVDVVGPKGWDFAAVSLGRLDVPKKTGARGVSFGVHRLQPLVEARSRFVLEIWELDNIVRGAADLDLSEAEKAAQRIAAFEDGAILNGLSRGNIVGIKQAAAHNLSLALTPKGFVDSVSQAVMTLKDSGVEDPYALLAGPKAFRALAGGPPGFPLDSQVRQLIGGDVVYSRVLDGAMLVSTRGGDFELTLGHDLSVGYETHDTRSVRFYLTESFTFRVLDPSAVVCLKTSGGRRAK